MGGIVIVGNGIAGITTARHVRKRSDVPITVISSESKYFYSRTALMYIYMGHLTPEQTKPYEDHFWTKNRIDLVYDHVEQIQSQEKKVVLRSGRAISYDKLVLATGAKPNYFGWPGQHLEGVQGLYSLQDLAKMETNSRGVKQAVIVGGGLIGIEMAEMLATRQIQVTFLVRENRYWGNVLPLEEARMIGRHIDEHHVNLKLNTNLKEILADEGGRVRAVTTDQGEEIPCSFVGLTAGVSPNIGLARASGLTTGRGIVVNRYLETPTANIYALGDCAELREDPEQRGRVEQLWYTGRMQGETLAKTLCGERTPYERGIWFNSAKFFDIEYHTYGFVANEPREGEANFYWEHPDGKKCLRLVYRTSDNVMVGMNAFGIRFRHLVFERWLREKRTVAEVLANLSEANFDPEFFNRYEPDIVAAYNQRHPSAALPVPRRKRFGWL